MSGYCVNNLHAECPDTKQDSYGCSCPCHLAPKVLRPNFIGMGENEDPDAYDRERDARATR